MNIHKGFSFFNSRFTLLELKKALHETDADIVFLQEVVGENLILSKKIQQWPTVSQSEFLAENKWPHHAYGKNAIYSQRHHGNAILSRFPLEFAENISLSTYRMEQRGLLHCAITIPQLETPLHLFNVHLDLTQMSRKRQLHKIIARAHSHVPTNSPLVLAGDFNDWSQQASSILNESLQLQESSKVHHGDYQRSFPNFFPFLRLDRLYFRHLKIKSVNSWAHAPWSNLSDHLPLCIEFEIQSSS